MESPTVAILGASGIGKHHAKWFHLAGSPVVAFAGTSEESCRQTASTLKEIFPFEGKAFQDVGALLDEARPDLVSICTPPECHEEHIAQCLGAGCHVLCEKPLHWLPHASLAEHEEILSRIQAASNQTRPFAVNLQFAAGVTPYQQVYEELTGTSLDDVQEFFVHWTPRPGGKDRDADWYWNDLGPHALSLLIRLCPKIELVRDSIECAVKPSGTEVTFSVKTGTGTCRADFRLTAPVDGKAVRKLGANGVIVDYSAKPDESGAFHTYLSNGEREWKFEDFMKASIERFIASTQDAAIQPFVTGDEAATNLRLQLEIFERASR